MRQTLAAFIFAMLLTVTATASALDDDAYAPLLIARFGNLDAIDAEDGDLAVFLKSIRNDGRFIPPMRTLVGPELRNPTFFGVTYEAWVEGVLLSPNAPGRLALVWVFPVDSRDEYMAQLVNQGLNEYEGMDDVSVLREADSDGNVHTWYLEWLPGGVAVFGADRTAVSSARRVYAENSAAAGLLAAPGGRFVEPDVTLRLTPSRLAEWQDSEPGSYWWRGEIAKLTADLVAFWNPNPARARLINALAEDFTAWPRTLGPLDLNVWFEPEGVEWRLLARGNFGQAPKSDLNILRSLPERAAAAYARPMTRDALDELLFSAADLALGAAGGVVSREARDAAESLRARVRDAGLREALWSWIAPPAGRPELGGCRLLVTDWSNADALEEAWTEFENALRPDTPLSRALSQLGWEASLRREDSDAEAAELSILPLADAESGAERESLYSALFVARRSGNRVALVAGDSRADAAARADVAAYRAGLAAECVTRADDGTADVRSAFTRVPADGAGLAAVFSPVRFMQLVLVESGDWSPRSPDQHEPLSAQLAREMLEYGAGGAWTAAGTGTGDSWDWNGGISWRSLSRLCAALGITESIGMD